MVEHSGGSPVMAAGRSDATGSVGVGAAQRLVCTY
jgi:hypothetical protein